MRLFLTRNDDKENDFVNGMGATVEEFDEKTGCMEVLTDTGKRLSFGKRTAEFEVEIPGSDSEDDVKTRKFTVSAYPVRLGYACTIYKVQGMTLPHVTIWLDRSGAKAAGYVALSRVRSDDDYLIAGKVTPAHFTPACGLPSPRLFHTHAL